MMNNNINLLNVNTDFSFMEFPLSISRQSDFPIDRYSLWWSYNDAYNYAKTNPTAYIGMVLSVHDVLTGNVSVYTINANKDLVYVGTPVDNKSISIHDEKLQINGFNAVSKAGMVLETRDKGDGTFETVFIEHKNHVPTPETANNAKFLRNDNTWQLVTPGNIGTYTKSEIDSKFSQLNSGMDWKESVATFDDLATTYPNPQDGWTVNVQDTDYTYRYSGSEWIAISANAIPNATSEVDGKMSKEDKAKLDSISPGANIYVHPSTHPATMITEDSTHRFVTDALIAAWTAKANTSGTYTGLNVGSATKWTTARTITLSGDVTGSVSLDGSTNVSLTTSVTDNSHKHTWSNLTDIPSSFTPSDHNQASNTITAMTGYAKGSVGGGILPTDNLNSAFSKIEVNLDGKQPKGDYAAASHGNHVPATETANNAKFLRNDNTWQLVTPGNIGAFPNTGGQLNGWLKVNPDLFFPDNKFGINMNNSDIIGVNSIVFNDITGEGIFFPKTGTPSADPDTSKYDRIYTKDGVFYLNSNKIYHDGNCNMIPTPETANNAKFLRNDNTWQLVTPGNIGTYTKSEIDSKVLNGVSQQRIGGYYSGSGGKQPPSFVESGKVKFLMSNESIGTDTEYKDWIYMDTYSGSDVPIVTAFGISKSTSLRAFLMQGAKAGSTWDRKAEIWHSGNFNPDTKANLSGAVFTGAVTASTLTAKGGIEIYHDSTPFIDFHYANSTADYTSRIIESSSGVLNISGSLTVNSNITGAKVYNAVWNDYAELFPKLKSTITEAGDIIALDIDNNKEVYTKATENSSSFVVGVHSDEYAHLIGGERPTDDYSGSFEDFNKDKFIPVGLAGRVRAKCVGIIKKGDKLVISDIPGVARAYNPKLDNINDVFGMAVENKNNPDVISRVKMFIKN